jgi:OOP family OmpA-OmpF porin
MKKTNTLVLAGSVAAFVAGMSFAQDSKNQGYLVDTYGNNIVTSPNTGLCWRTRDWTPERAVASCDPVATQAEAPAPKVAATAPPPSKSVKPPAPAFAPAKMASQAINFSADTLFAFDKSVLKPEGMAALDGFVNQLSGVQFQSIFVTGHTDRFGGDEYNQKLSERRANAVKDYLVSRNVEASRVKAEGKGETQPVTRPGECVGPQSIKVIACLQPDRRVHIEVTGAKPLTTSP